MSSSHLSRVSCSSGAAHQKMFSFAALKCRLQRTRDNYFTLCSRYERNSYNGQLLYEHDKMESQDDLLPPPPVPPSVEPVRAEEADVLPPPPLLPPNLDPIKAEEAKKLANLKYEDDLSVDGKGVGSKVIDSKPMHLSLHINTSPMMVKKSFHHFNNEFILFLEDISSGKTAANGSLGNGSRRGSDRKRVSRPYQTNFFKVELCFAAKISMSAIAMTLKARESEHTQEAIWVIDIILRQHSAKQGCLLVSQTLFHNNTSNFVDLGGGVMGL